MAVGESLEKLHHHILLLVAELQIAELLAIHRLRILGRRPARYLLARISHLAPRQRVAGVIVMDHLLERLKVSIVHVGFHEAGGTRTLVDVPQGRCFVLSEKRLGLCRPLAVRILRTGQEATHPQIEEFKAVRIGGVAEFVRGVLLIEREGWVRRQAQVGGGKIGEYWLLSRASISVALVAVRDFASEQFVGVSAWPNGGLG
jgi:hypothetical protein